MGIRVMISAGKREINVEKIMLEAWESTPLSALYVLSAMLSSVPFLMSPLAS